MDAQADASELSENYRKALAQATGSVVPPNS
jgi:hypothetical protein